MDRSSLFPASRPSRERKAGRTPGLVDLGFLYRRVALPQQSTARGLAASHCIPRKPFSCTSRPDDAVASPAAPQPVDRLTRILCLQRHPAGSTLFDAKLLISLMDQAFVSGSEAPAAAGIKRRAPIACRRSAAPLNPTTVQH